MFSVQPKVSLSEYTRGYQWSFLNMKVEKIKIRTQLCYFVQRKSYNQVIPVRQCTQIIEPDDIQQTLPKKRLQALLPSLFTVIHNIDLKSIHEYLIKKENKIHFEKLSQDHINSI